MLLGGSLLLPGNHVLRESLQRTGKLHLLLKISKLLTVSELLSGEVDQVVYKIVPGN